MRYAVSVALLWLSVVFQSHAQEFRADVAFTEPTCGPYKLEKPVFSLDGDVISEKRGNVFCTDVDYNGGAFLNGPVVARLRETLKNGIDDPITEISIAYYKIQDEGLADYLCKQESIKPFLLKIFTQAGEDFRFFPVELQKKLECFGTNMVVLRLGCDVMALGEQCPKGSIINTFHPKVISVSKESGRKSFVVSSGNLNRGIISNLEDWMFLSALAIDAVSTQHSCMFDTFHSFRNTNDRNLLNKTHIDCLRNAGASKGDNGINSVLLPAGKDVLYKWANIWSKSADRIDIFTQDFRDSNLISAIDAAASKGAVIRFFVDDDWHYAEQKQGVFGTATGTETKPVYSLMEKYPSNIYLNFFETNHDTIRNGNTVHHKFMLFHTGAQKALIAGAANFTAGAIRGNMDNVYIIENSHITQQYADYVDRMVGRSVPHSKMPREWVRPVLTGP